MNKLAKLGLLAGTSYVIWSYGALAQQIPSFPSATTPFSGGEQTYLVQGGASKNMTLNQLATWAGPTTISTTTLRAACTSATSCPSGDPVYPNGVERLSYSGTFGDAPPIVVTPDVSGVCSSDDSGYCISSANSGFWLATTLGGQMDFREWGVNVSAADNSAAFQTALQTALAHNFKLVEAPGTFNFTNSVSGTIPGGQSFTIMGAGQDVTVLKYTGSSGLLTLNFTNEHSGLTLSDTTFLANSAGAGSGLSLVQQNNNIGNEAGSAEVTINNVTWRGGLGAGTANYWTTAFAEQGISSINFNNDTVFLGTAGLNGDAFSLSGLSSASQSVILNFNGVNVAGGRYGIIYGSWVQGVAVNYSNFDEQLSSIIINGSGGGDQLTVLGGQFGINNGHTIDCVGQLGGLLVDGATFTSIPSGFAGVHINSLTCGNTIVADSIFAPKSANVGIGVAVVSNQLSSRTILQGDSFLGLNNGINLSSGLSGAVQIGPNAYQGNGINVVDNNLVTVYSSSVPIAGSTGVLQSAGGSGNVFMSIGASGSTTEAPVTLLSTPGIFNITSCRAQSAPGSGQTQTMTFRINNVSTGLTCIVSGAAFAGTVSGLPVTIASQQIWDVLGTPSASAVAATLKWTGTFSPAP